MRDRCPTVNALTAAVALMLSLAACTDPSGPSPAELQGRNAFEEGRFDLARIHLEVAVAEQPGDLELCALFARSWSSGTMQSPIRAIAAWEDCRELEPSEEASLGIAQGHLRLGAYAESVAALEGIDASADAAQLRGEALLHLDPERAMGEIAAAVERFPDHVALRKLASRTAHLSEDFDSALAHLTRALELDPLDGRMYYLEGRTRQQLGDTDGAALAFERHQLASRLTGAGGWPEAPTLEKLRLLDQLGVRTPRVEVLAMEWQFAVGRHTEAVEAAERLAVDTAARPSDLLRAETVAASLGRFELAHDLLRRTSEYPLETQLEREVRYRRANLLLLENNPEEALAVIERALEIDPWAARFLDLRAHIEAVDGDDDAAAKSLGRVLQLAPWRVDSRLALAEIEIRRGQNDRAEALLSSAPEPSPAIHEFRRRHGLG